MQSGVNNKSDLSSNRKKKHSVDLVVPDEMLAKYYRWNKTPRIEIYLPKS